jgi:EAL domain-containing protein (putative c-di-GMP-specific phosphodiesterase class I)
VRIQSVACCPPAEFLLVAEETGLMPDLDRWVLYRSLLALCEWRNAPGHFTGYVSVNISAQSLDQPDLAEQIAGALDALQLPAEALQVEITESSMVRDLAAAVQTVQRIQSLGVRIAIDDFGTGYSSLTHLSRVPADVLKVDGTFVQRLDVSEQDAEIVRLILALSRAMGVETIAEGIETPQQARLLMQLGCRFGQGFYFQHPVDVEAAAALVPAADGDATTRWGGLAAVSDAAA